VLNRLVGLLFGTGKFQEAKKYALKVVEYYPDNVDALKNMTLIYYNLEEYNKSYSYYQRLLAVKPDFQPREADSIFKDLIKRNSLKE
jgi:tetratricopeptide (TPR) repeat protein